ncbi:MAG: T9SS type A sorting domain-containing protein [Bacteroidota bacterium]|nr:T9SS type A sorting domain-containing protein [Bacteroidota bacterium]
MKKNICLLILLLCSCAYAQMITIVDSKFEQILVEQGIDTDAQINGMIAQADALAVTTLFVDGTSVFTPCSEPEYFDCFIRDFSGLEFFVNIEELTISWVALENLDLSGLVNLKKLSLFSTNLTTIDLSNNIQLEELEVPYAGDMLPMNEIQELDLSNNPNIKNVRATGIRKIDLRNGNNNPQMKLVIGCVLCETIGQVNYNVCIAVDDADAAIQGMFPYSEWDINHLEVSYSYSVDLEGCSLNTEEYSSGQFVVYPNPATDYITFYTSEDIVLQKVIIYDYLGKIIWQDTGVTNNSLDVKKLPRGSYLVKLVTDSGVQIHKVIIK